MQSSPRMGSTQQVKARLSLAVSLIDQQQQRLIEAHLLRLWRRHTMLLVLARVTVIPIEANDGREVDHGMYMMVIYDWCKTGVADSGVGTPHRSPASAHPHLHITPRRVLDRGQLAVARHPRLHLLLA